jgi:hypothetical protein
VNVPVAPVAAPAPPVRATAPTTGIRPVFDLLFDQTEQQDIVDANDNPCQQSVFEANKPLPEGCPEYTVP